MSYEVITWPESQELEGFEGFEDNAYAVCDEIGIETFGPNAYFVDEDWLKEINYDK